MEHSASHRCSPSCGRREYVSVITVLVLALLTVTSLQHGPEVAACDAATTAAAGIKRTPASLQDAIAGGGGGGYPSGSSNAEAALSPVAVGAAAASASSATPIVGAGSGIAPGLSTAVRRPFRFHIYKLPRQFVEGALEQLHANWQFSICNRGSRKTNYTMLDWRHAHSLFTADIYITRFLRLHPQHTDDPSEADAVIIPMMSHLYNCAGTMHYMTDILTHIVTRYPAAYKQLDHRDHYLFWWRWGMHYGNVKKFWSRVTRYFPNVNLISFDLLEIMGRNGYQDFSLALKPRFDRNLLNIIVPYPDLSPLLRVDVDPASPQAAAEIQSRPRKFLFYFAGTSTIGGVRRWIKWNCDRNSAASSSGAAAAAADCVYVDFATSVVDTKRLGVPTDYPRAMRDSVFCGHAAGDALSSRRPTSAVLAGCIPVLICDLCLYAWESTLDYSSFAVFIPEADVMAGKLVATLKAIAANATHQRLLRENLLQVRRHFVYHEGAPQPGDALDMLAGELERRGTLQRQFRRWYRANPGASADLKDYPVEPPNAMRYVRRMADGAIDKQDAAKFPHQPLPAV